MRHSYKLTVALTFFLSLFRAEPGASSEDEVQQTFGKLSVDTANIIMAQISEKDLGALVQVSKWTRAYFSQDKFWKPHYEKYYIYSLPYYMEISKLAKFIVEKRAVYGYFKGLKNLESLDLKVRPVFKTLIQCRSIILKDLQAKIEESEKKQDLVNGTKGKRLAAERYFDDDAVRARMNALSAEKDKLLVAEELLCGVSTRVGPQIESYIDGGISDIKCIWTMPAQESEDLISRLLDRFIKLGSKYALKKKQALKEQNDTDDE